MTNERAQTELTSLKGCPFCGGKAHWPEPEVNIPYVGCTECGACAQDEVRWNTRTSSPETPVSDDELLPCDVKLPPATTIAQGCKLSTLIHALELRGMKTTVPTPPADVSSLIDVRDRFWVNVPDRPASGCWEWTGTQNGSGYGSMRCFGRTRRATHIAILLQTGELPPKGMVVCHHCDNPSCVRPDHLFVGTSSENMRDCVRKGRHRCNFVGADRSRGSRHGSAKLTESDVLAIRLRLASEGPSAVAAKYGVSETTIRRIRDRRIWAHV